MKCIRHSLKNYSDLLLKSHFNRALFIVRVQGESGWPMLVPGRRYLASGLFVPRTSDWAVFRHPHEPGTIYIKRVREILDTGYIMEGTVSWASSSDDFGPVPKQYIIGKVFV